MKRSDLPKVRTGGGTSAIASSVIALFAGLSVAILADSTIFKLLGLGAAFAPFLLLSISALKRTILAVALLEVIFPIDVYIGHALNPDELGAIATLNPDHVNAVAGFNLSVTTFCLIVLYGLWMAERLAGHEARTSWYRPLVPAFAYAAGMVVSMGVAQSPVLALYEITIVIQALLLMVYVVHFVFTRRNLWFVVGVLMAGLSMQSILVLAQAGLGFTLDIGPLGASARGARLGGTIGSPNELGSYLCLMAAPALGLAMSRVNAKVRYWAGATWALATASLFLSGSRGAWAGFAASMAVMSAVAYRRSWVSRKILFIGVTAFGVIVVGIVGDAIAGRLTSGSTLENRLDLVEIALSMIRDRPFLGVGANNFAASIGPYVTQEFSATWISTVHNKYALVWAETGLLALVPFLWLLTSGLSRAWRTSNVSDLSISPLILGLGAGVLANMIHMSVEIYHGRQQIQMLWVVLGLIIAAANVVAFQSRGAPNPGASRASVDRTIGHSLARTAPADDET